MEKTRKRIAVDYSTDDYRVAVKAVAALENKSMGVLYMDALAKVHGEKHPFLVEATKKELERITNGAN